jgi:hypothetical protein
MLIHPWLANITHHSPVLLLMANVIIAGILISPHHYIEHLINHKLVEKNREVRLKAARKTIASLGEDGISSTNNSLKG